MEFLMLKTAYQITLILLSSLIFGCQYQQTNQFRALSSELEFTSMISKAESCISKNSSPSQCYQKAFPQRCRNFANEMNFERSTTREKLNNCVSACQQAPIASRSLGACSVIL